MAGSSVAAQGIPATTHSRAPRALLVAMAVGLLLSWAAAAGKRTLDRSLATTLPSVPPAQSFIDDTPVRIRVTAVWQKIAVVETYDALRSDWTLWRRMHVEDWDVVPLSIRQEGLEAMFERYRHLLTNPSAWDRMDAHDWDLVPQPVRAFAYRHMVEYWSGYYDVGSEYGIPPGLMADTLAAIILTESWFEHRAMHVNAWGNRDVGVAQASDGARERLRDLYHDAQVDVLLEDEDYFDPWKGTRFVALWMRLILGQVGGDLPAAVRAYHRGWRRAVTGEGEEYLQLVRRRRHRYIRNRGGSPAWGYLWERDRRLTAAAWPWTRIEHDRRTRADGRADVSGPP